MKKIKFIFMGIICIACFGMVNYAGASFLKAQKFPKTIDDLSFVERMRIRAEGYDALETVYDANGRCVSGCAYAGITLQEEEDMIAQATNELRAAVALHNVLYPQLQLQEQQGQQGQENSETVISGGAGTIIQDSGVKSCNASRVAGFESPLSGDIVVTSDFGERVVRTGTTYHRGIDLRASTGTEIYAPADGRVIFSGSGRGYGNYVKIEHSLYGTDKKITTVYAHLNRIDVRNGQQVSKGYRIGMAGNTGTSSGPHLHYEVRYDNVKVDPLGAYVKPVLDGVYNHETSKGKNFLSGEYCFENNITSSRLQKYKTDVDSLKRDFPCCRGFCY